jgi:hypothetical protein
METFKHDAMTPSFQKRCLDLNPVTRITLRCERLRAVLHSFSNNTPPRRECLGFTSHAHTRQRSNSCLRYSSKDLYPLFPLPVGQALPPRSVVHDADLELRMPLRLLIVFSLPHRQVLCLKKFSPRDVLLLNHITS